ncbi:MAG TPA: hypothetical protein VM008_20895 [Phycisphaerae bacterium]|nr:hypothetical protein [Phycisphaerae bacterium]
MDVGQIQSGLVGMALFDSYMSSVDAAHHKKHQQGDPLVAAAFAAFEGYLNTVEASNAAMIAGVSAQLGANAAGAGGAALNVYGLNSQGTGVISQQQMAPLLALNVLA